LSPDLNAYITRSVLCWLATVDDSGHPNVSPKEVFCAWGDDSILIANIASPESAKNIRSFPGVCVSFVDVFVQKGFKVKGLAKIVESSSPEYQELIKPLEAITKGVFSIINIFQIKITKVSSIVAPSYRIYPDRTEEQQIESALHAYGVKRA